MVRCDGGFFTYTIQATVTVSGGKIADISVAYVDWDPDEWNDEDNNYYLFDVALPAVKDGVIGAQSAGVDVTSGASYSTPSLLQAVREALAQAAN